VKVVSITEAAPQLGQLVLDALNGEQIILELGEGSVELIPNLGADSDDFVSEEMEAEILRGLEGKATPYVEGEFVAMLQKMRAEKKSA